MMIGFLFPGQGSQKIGMGKDLYEQLPAAAAVLDRACECLGFDLKKLMWEGPEEDLNNTRYAQAAIYTCSMMALEKAKAAGMTPDFAAGHSLGEYSALAAAGVFSFEEGLQLVWKRGEAMSRQNGKGTMAAVIGVPEEELLKAVEPVRDRVVLANLNTPSQIVISGEGSGIDTVEEALSGREGVMVKRLAVSAAFHSPQMKEAAEIMTPILEKTEFRTPICPVVSNVTGKPSIDPAELKVNLIAQITGQVRWYDSILNMTQAGVETFYEIGNGRILRGMNRSIPGAAKCESL